MTTAVPTSIHGVIDYNKCPRRHYLSKKFRVRSAAPIAVRRGRILHAGVSAAYSAAAGATGPVPAGATMRRFEPQARAAVSRSWRAEMMPADAGLANGMLDTISRVLARLSVPRPDQVVAVEQRMELTTPAGNTITTIPDLVLRSGEDLLVRDWKSSITGRRPARDPQLCVYTAAVADLGRTIHQQFYPLNDDLPISALADPRQVVRVLDMVDATIAAARADEVFEPRPAVAKCAGCPVLAICPEGKRATGRQADAS